MRRGIQGKLLPQGPSQEPFRSFVPKPLPPSPALELSPELLHLMERAGLALGRLDGLGRQLPDLKRFLYFYIRKEAILSSQIEGMQSSLSELLLFETNQLGGVPTDDVVEVSNYVSALQRGLKLLRQGLPISSRLIKEMHGVLLAKGRGKDKEPGEFRTSQNWIGGTRPGNAAFVPPPKDEVTALMGQIETFYHDNKSLPSLVKVALIHVPFETIHPFLDGNGRLGRLLITLMLVADDALSEPLLYLSLYFKQHRSEYYELLQRVRHEGDWEEWLTFFFTAVRDTAEQAVTTANNVLQLFQRDRSRIEQLGRIRGTSLLLHGLFQRNPYLTISAASQALHVSPPSVTRAMEELRKLRMIKEISGRSWNRIFEYTSYMRFLSEGAEAPEPQSGLHG